MKIMGYEPLDLSLHKDVQKAMFVARRNLLQNPVAEFYAMVMMQLPLYVVDADEVTGATNYKNIIIGKKYFMEQDAAQQQELLIHEVLHVCMKHNLRKKNRDHQLWNVACDFQINDQEVQMGFKLTNGSLHDLKYRDMSCEDIYDDLIQSGAQYNLLRQDLSEVGEMGDGDSDQNFEQEINDILVNTTVAMDMQNKSSGVPKNVRDWVNELLKPKVSWQSILRRYMNAKSTTAYNWNRPRKRYRHLGLYLPQMSDVRMDKLTMAFDVSGSIGKKEFDEFTAEAYACFNVLKPNCLEVIQFDTSVISVDPVKRLADFRKVNFTGGGGTCLVDLMNHFIQSKSKLLVVLTDGYFSNNLPVPKNDVIWCIYGNKSWQPPFGKVIHLDFK